MARGGRVIAGGDASPGFELVDQALDGVPFLVAAGVVADGPAAEGLQKLLGVAGTGQVPDVEAVEEHVAEMRAVRECLVAAIGNVDILLDKRTGMTALLDED